MQKDAGAMILRALDSAQYKKRLDHAREFEGVSGGGVLKQVQRLLVAPDIYVPYVFYAKAKLSSNYSTATTLFWGRVVQMPLEDYDALILYMYGALHGSEMKFTKFLAKNLTPDDIFYDVGANRGFYTFLAAELCKETHSFEPLVNLAEVIRKNVRKDENVNVNAAALSDTNGTADFYTSESTMVGTIDASVAEQVAAHERRAARKVTVPTLTLSEYLKTHAKPTVLKIDVEGAEEHVLKGGRNFFAENSPVVAMEIWGKENKWELSMRAATWLRDLGYHSYALDVEGNLQKADGDLSVNVPPEGGENFVFKK